MFRMLTSLFWGGDDETTQDETPHEESQKTTPQRTSKSGDESQRTSKFGDMDDTEWHLVNHHETAGEVSAGEETTGELANHKCSFIPVTKEPEANIASDLGSDVRLPEPDVSVQRSRSPSRVILGSSTGALAKVTQVARVQRAQARCERRCLGRTSMQRQNCIRQRGQVHANRSVFPYLQQPGRRSNRH